MADAVLTPRQVLERQLAAITTRSWDELDQLYAEDVVVDLPFNLPQPLRLEGRGQLHARFAATSGLPLQLDPRNLVIHETDDPEVVVAEFDYEARMTDSGRTFSVANVLVMRVRNGQIVASRDYHNHAVMAEFLGSRPELTSTPR